MEAAVQVAAVMGIDPGTVEPLKSLNTCQGGERAEDKFIYAGVNSCRALATLSGGKRECRVGCLGFGDCIRCLPLRCHPHGTGRVSGGR